VKPIHLNHLLAQPKTASASLYFSRSSDFSIFEELLKDLHRHDQEALARTIMKQKLQIKKILATYPNQSLGFFFTQDTSGYSFINHRVEDYFTYGHSFHLRPLLEDIFVNPEFIVVNVSLYDIKVFRGDFHHIEVLKHFEFDNVAASSKIFGPNHIGLIPFKNILAMKNIAKDIMEMTYYHSVPVIVTGLAEMKTHFMKYFDHRIDVIEVEEDFYEKTCLQILEKCRGYRHQLLDFYALLLKRQFGRMTKVHRLLNDVGDIIQAIHGEKVIHLVLPAHTKLWGNVDFETGKFALDDTSNVDILNELADHIIRQGGQIQILGPHFFPEENPVYAILKGS
jgi:hypothetical protein